ncbi:MAG: hypothetical protein IT322_07620 [Anaerolineae bacterium]|nr:hypothetical protein [Anaerolineae bacterium]
MAETPFMPEEPDDFWDWLPPEAPEVDWGEGLAEQNLPEPAFEALLQELAQSQTLEPPPEVETTEYTPQSLMERYLASLPAGNPDVLEGAFLERARALNLSDARFVALENLNEDGSVLNYEVGAMEVYADPEKGETSGRYLTVAHAHTLEALEAAYFPLQMAVEYGGVGAHSLHHFAGFAAGEGSLWQEASPAQMEAYWEHVGLSLPEDEPPLETYADLLREAAALGAPAQELDGNAAFRALSAIGVKAQDFDPTQDPPPFFDPETSTAYWIGVFQPDLNDADDCYASILSLGRDPETGELEAQLAPCVPGDWDKAYQSSQHLLGVMQKEGIDACFLAAESMAIATDQREVWESERGVTVSSEYAQEVADYAREAWEIEL